MKKEHECFIKTEIFGDPILADAPFLRLTKNE
jgi:hypothetical protein